MARLRTGVVALSEERLGRLHLELVIGPCEADRDELEVAWGLLGGEIMSEPQGSHGTRPWAWWEFEAEEPQPGARWNPDEGHLEGVGDEMVRLAELGELTDAELAALRERSNEARLRVGTDGEYISGGSRNTPGAVSVDVQAVELWERVEAALQRG